MPRPRTSCKAETSAAPRIRDAAQEYMNTLIHWRDRSNRTLRQSDWDGELYNTVIHGGGHS